MIVMNLEKIKVKDIPEQVKVWCEDNANNTAFTYGAYYEYICGEVIQRIFATRRYNRYGVRIREVSRAATGHKSPHIVRDFIYNNYGTYVPLFEAEDKYCRCSGWGYKVFDKEDFGKWYPSNGRCGFGYVNINPTMIFDIPEFKYCSYSGNCGLLSYLDSYREDKSIEFFGKMGLSLSPVLIKKAKADKQFRRYLWENHNAVALYGVQATLYAYKHHIPTIEEARRICYVKTQLDRLVVHRLPEIRGTKIDRQRVLDYVDSNDINYASYDDYLKCCKALNLNLSDTKVIYPNDFKRMHDLRSDEYKAHQAKIDRRKRAKLYKSFREKAQRAKQYEYSNENYMIIVPTEISDLIREGDVLSHCVGKMGYDKKMADGVSLIMFCRKTSDPTVPFVTVEYRLDKKALNQCYGFKDSRPNDDVIEFVNSWAADLTQKLQKTPQVV